MNVYNDLIKDIFGFNWKIYLKDLREDAKQYGTTVDNADFCKSNMFYNVDEYYFYDNKKWQEKEDKWELKLKLPGLDKQFISVNLRDNKLFLSYQLPQDYKSDFYENKRFSYSWSINEGVIPEDVSVLYKDGVLVLEIKKHKKEKKEFKIEVK